MKIIIDKNIPFIKDYYENTMQLKYCKGIDIKPEIISDSDCLLIRTRTTCNKDLLKNSKVKLIVSATAGVDHIDLDYCKEKSIIVEHCPGANAFSVVQYVISSILSLFQKKLQGKVLGIVGYGNVGSLLAAYAKKIDLQIIVNDPPLQKQGKITSLPLKELLAKSDIVSLHTPLTYEGEHKTFKLIGKNELSIMKKNAYLINSARGGVCDEEALKKALIDKEIGGAIIDCWYKEPNIDLELLKLCDIGTPHIAGYALDSKIRATKMSVKKINNFFGFKDKELSGLPSKDIMETYNKLLDFNAILREVYLKSYNPVLDSNLLKNSPDKFEYFRNNYPVRREPSSYIFKNSDKNILEQLKAHFLHS